ncbi:MAG: Gfo/Idh/MocA family protein [Negativicutes bacterium]|jgi:myo-inositol 2-dehydrogenase/D-chiro-inositol 1-dehydrogenase
MALNYSRIGVGVIGCGKIGSLRANNASQNYAVKYLAVCDLVESKAQDVAKMWEADDWTTDYKKVIDNPQVDAIIISTTEPSHFEIIMYALSAEKPVLVEKPIVLDLNDAKYILDVSRDKNIKLFVGYTQRFRRRFLAVKEHIVNGYINDIDSGFAKIYTPLSQGDAVLSRSPLCVPAINLLTYPIDLILWYLEDKSPKSLFAQLVSRNTKPVATWAILTFEDGTVCTLGASRQFPRHYPAHVATMEFELFGSNGSISIDDSHRDCVLASEKPIPSPYLKEGDAKVAFLGSAMPGDWALGHFYGPMKEETNAFIESVCSGVSHPVLTTAEQACRTLEISHAIIQSYNSNKPVSLSIK